MGFDRDLRCKFTLIRTLIFVQITELVEKLIIGSAEFQTIKAVLVEAKFVYSSFQFTFLVHFHPFH